MTYLYPMVAATAISLAIIPAMVRLAPWLGMMDQPDGRKIHGMPIPRVGGWGIVIGALLPILIWAPLDPLMLSYVFGALILLAFGALDDRREMGHYTKFVGQFVAVVPVVTYGGLYVTSFPLLGPDALPPFIGKAFTLFAIVGMINAVNHSDGLDGLAGGESLLSLSAMAYLAYLAHADVAIVMILASIGGLLGFLRYNTHPASVFMGDGGSQFLGFTLGFLAVLLTQRLDPSLSPAVVLLLLGLPIVDILVVLKRRITSGMNWFRATRNHIHHRLLNLGFVHEESVVIIYSIQAVCVISAIILRHQRDWLIMLVYFSTCGVVFALINAAEKSGWKAQKSSTQETFGDALSFVRHTLLVVAPRRFLDLAIPGYLIGGSLLAKDVPHDFGWVAAAAALLMLVDMLFIDVTRSIARRALIYAVATFVIYLHLDYPEVITQWMGSIRYVFFTLVALSVAVAIRFSPRRRRFEFEATAMDYLMVVVVLITSIYAFFYTSDNIIMGFVVKLIIILYSCELMIIEKRNRWNVLTSSALIGAGVLAVRGLL